MLRRTDSIAVAIGDFGELVRRYPDSWYGWMLYGDVLMHDGPMLGHPIAEAREAFRKATVLNADLIPVWEHVALAALVESDTTEAVEAVQALARLDAWPVLTADGYGDRPLQFHYLLAVHRRDHRMVAFLTDSLARDPAPAATTGSFNDPFRFCMYPEQIAVSRAALAHGVAPDHRQLHEVIVPLSFIGRGAWDSALAGLDTWTRTGLDSLAALRTYGLAALGAWLGAVDVEDAVSRRARVAGTSHTPSERAELAWIDGVVASARRDAGTLERARAELGRSGDPAATALDRSLAALGRALQGDSAGAGAELATLEWEQAATGSPAFVEHPLAIPLDRIAGARWLATSGDAERALRLLRWADARFLLHPAGDYTMAFTAMADLEGARIEKQLGRREQAGALYARFLRLYDLPPAGHRGLVAEAKLNASR